MSETPPLSRPPRYDPWATIAATLRRHPGIWHAVEGDATTATTNINDGVLAAFRPAGEYEAKRTAGILEVRYVDKLAHPDKRQELLERYAADHGVTTAEAIVMLDEGAVECVVCRGTGRNELGARCVICRGAGVIA